MRALVLVDLQPDFCAGGALAVAGGDETIAVANAIAPRFDLVVATQDWHPRDHGSFAANHPGTAPGQFIDLFGLRQILWPVHCVQDTAGAAIHPGLAARIDAIFPKGTDRTVDSYSGFYDNGKRNATGLGMWLRDRKVTDVWVMGLATDYCVKFTALDGVADGFQVSLIADGCRGVNLAAGDDDRAIAAMRAAGVVITASSAA